MNKVKRLSVIVAVAYLVALAALYFFQSRIVFIPTKLEADYEFNFGVEFTAHFLESKDGSQTSLFEISKA